MQIVSAAGLTDTKQISRTHVFRRVDQMCIKRYDELFPYLTPGCLSSKPYQEYLERDTKEASVDSFCPIHCIASHDKGPEIGLVVVNE